jgi:hypothetical protein
MGPFGILIEKNENIKVHLHVNMYYDKIEGNFLSSSCGQYKEFDCDSTCV